MAMGHSRVPVYYQDPMNIIGLVLVKNLLAVDPEKAIPLRKRIIRRIPRVSANMPLYDILNEFQKGHSHIAVVYKDVNETKRRPKDSTKGERKIEKHDNKVSTVISYNLGSQLEASDACPSSNKSVSAHQAKKATGAIPTFKKRHRGCSFCILDIENAPLPVFPPNEVVVGVISMEDVIEELLQEEILDETDEYVNIHNRIKVNMGASHEKLPGISDFQQSASSSSVTHEQGPATTVLQDSGAILATKVGPDMVETSLNTTPTNE